MKTRVLIFVVILAAIAGGYFWGSGGVDNAATKPAAPVASQEMARKGDGSGGNKPAGAREKKTCDNLLALYSGPELLWEKGGEAFSAMPETHSLEESHRSSTKGVNLRDFVTMAPDVEVVEVVTCEGLVARWPVDKLAMEQNLSRFYIALNSRGAFKMIDFYDGAEQTIMKNIVRITLKPGGQRRIEAESDPAQPAE